MVYTSVRDRTWYKDGTVYHKDHADEDVDLTATVIDKPRVNTATIDWMIQMEDDDTFDAFLLQEYKEHFQGYTTNHFDALDKRLRKALKEMLRQHGIFLAQGNGESLPKQLMDLLKAPTVPQWPLDQLKLMRLCEGFKCQQIADDEERLRQQRASSSQPPQPPQPESSYPFSTPLSQPPNHTYLLTNLSKLYTTEQKYSGEKYDILKTKVKVFDDLCGKVGITEEVQLRKAFSIMLSGRALQYYYDHIAPYTLTYTGMVDKMKAYFNNTQAHQMYLQEWHDTTLKNVMVANPGKNPMQCLEIVITKMNIIYQALSQDWGDRYSEHVLAAQLLNACRGIEATTMACMKPATTFEGVASDLRNAVSMWIACHPHSQFLASGANEQYYTDRRYNRNDRQGSPSNGYQGRRQGQHRNSGNRVNRDNRQSGNRQNKTCFICKKPKCWSTRHTKQERQEHRRRYRQYLQDEDLSGPSYEVFLAGHEGIEGEDDDDHDDDEAANDDIKAYFSYQAYNTSSCGKIDGQAVVSRLNDAAALHAITREDPYVEGDAAEDPQLFSFDTRYGADIFQGIMPDTGAAGVSTAGTTQVKALQLIQPSAVINHATAGRCRIRFGDNPECISVGDVNVTTPFGTITFAVMPTNTPFLLCLNDMDNLGIFFNNVDNVLVQDGKAFPVIRKWGHPWLLLDKQETVVHHLTEVELRQLHRRFGHPAAHRLHKVLEKAGHDDVDRSIIDRINKYCHQCQMHGKAPGRFRFTVRDDMDFNSCVIVNVMYINQKPVLHAVDEATAFQAARFMPNVQANTTWDLLRAMWIDMYIGPPDLIKTDAGKNFVADDFVKNARALAIEVEDVPVEAHHSIGKVERYHAPIRRAYDVISADLGRSIAAEHVLQMAVKAVNDTAGPDGLVPTLLVFGTYPRLSKTSPPSPSITARGAAIHKAMNEVRKIKTKRQVNEALATRNGPDITDVLQLPIPSDVKVWRENTGWSGPHQMIAIHTGKKAVIVEVNDRQIVFRITSVRPYHGNDTTVIPNSPEDDGMATGDDPRDEEYLPTMDDLPPRPRRGRPKGSKNKPKPKADEVVTATVNLSQRERDDLVLARKLRQTGKITTPGQPFETSTITEIDALISQGVFRFEKYNPHRHGNVRIFKSRIVNEVKGKTTDQPYEKSRLVIQGYADNDKKLVLTQSPTIQRASQRVIMALAPSLIKKGMHLWLRDITQAYTQSDDSLQRTIIADLPTQLKDSYPANTIMVVIKPLYGIAEAGAYWWSTYNKHHTDTLHMTPSTYDPCLLISKNGAECFGIVGMQTDDTLGLTDKAFADLEDKELRFKAKPKQFLAHDAQIDFNGCIVRVHQHNGNIMLRQKKQGEKLEAAVDRQSYIQQRARGAYIATTCQPEASFDLAAAAQASDLTKEEIAKLN